MKSRCASFVLVVTVWVAGATVAAQVPGPINATGTSAAFVSAESTGHPLVGMGSDATPYGIMGTFSNHPLGFRTNNIARMFIDTNGNVGIGTTEPGYKLDVSGDANITGTYRVNGVPISATANWTQGGNNIYYTTGNVGIGTTTPAAKLTVSGAGYFNTPGAARFDLYDTTAGDGYLQHVNDGMWQIASINSALTRMVIDPSGNVGIGTTNPTAKLHVVEGGSGSGVHGSSSSGPGVYGSSSSGYGVYGISTSSYGVYGISTSSYAVYGNSSGGVGVAGFTGGGIGVYGASSPGGYAGVFLGNVRVVGPLCADNVSCASDARLKQNITPLSYGLREVLQLRPARWQWKDPSTTQLNLGLVAQDVEPVLPEFILRNVDTHGSLGLNYFGFVPVMIRAIQEQQDTITALDARIRALEQALLHQSQAQ